MITNNISRKDIEIMAPAGSFESLNAAIDAGADAVYFGAGRLNMRSASSVNFTISDLEQIVNICHQHNVKTYLTLNTIIYDEDIEQMKENIAFAKSSGIDSIIASDWAVINEARKQEVNVHCSTQLNITNSMAISYYAQYAEVIVLARELNIEQVRHIYDYIQANNITTPSGKPLRIEMFIHGALCMAISGKCYLSLDNYNRSANRGECVQLCRRGYSVEYLATDEDKNYQIAIDNKYIMSPKDLCTIGFLDRIIDAGARVLKIEGRGRSPEYVKRVVECYNEALEHIFAGI
jgi:putative protease